MSPPSLVIAGAPRCGTSALYRWLADHPGAATTATKETNYLLDPGHPLALPGRNYHDAGLAGYAQLFADCPAGAVVLEATAHYLYQATAATVLAGLPAPPVVVILLREPAARVHSSFRHSRDNRRLLPTDVSFAAYLAAVRSGSLAQLAPHSAPGDLTILGRELDYSRYVDHLRPWLEGYPRDRLVLELSENLERDPRPLLGILCRLTGLDPGGYRDYPFAASNRTYRPLLPWLDRGLRGLRPWLPPSATLLRFKRWYRQRWTRPAAALAPADQAIVGELATEYAAANRALAARTGLVLDPWRPA